MKVRGIVLHCTKYSETSVIAKIYTDKLGLLSFIIKGVRSEKSKNKAALYQPFSLLNMEINHRENRSLQFIRECNRLHVYRNVPFNTAKATLALFVTEVISKAVHEHEVNEELFEFALDTFLTLDEDCNLNPDFHLIFLSLLCRYIGIYPHLNYTENANNFNIRDGGFNSNHTFDNLTIPYPESSTLYSLFKAGNGWQHRYTNSRAERQKLLQVLLRYYQYHIDHFQLRSTEVLAEIFT